MWLKRFLVSEEMRVLNAEPYGYSSQAREILLEVGELVEISLTTNELKAMIADFDVLIVRLGFQIDRAVIDAGERLKVIVTATTGLDHIDIEYAHAKGIKVLSLRGELDFLRSIVATAEHTWGLLLALTRRIPWAFDSVRSGDWNRDLFRGNDLRGKRLGVLGLGRIGEKVANYGLAFGMRVSAYDPFNSLWIDGVERCISLEQLCAQSDVLSMHVPLDSSTHKLLDQKLIYTMPEGALVLNTSRGQILDEVALLHALEAGHLGGAAVDVLTTERSSELSSLVSYAQTHDNLLITPHIGGATQEAMADTEIFMAKQLQKWCAEGS